MAVTILAHRGQWLNQKEKNSPIAFERALRNGFGLEIDIRDHENELVISHDTPSKPYYLAKDFFVLYNSINPNLPIAINIKSDGLQTLLKNLVYSYNITNFFTFDMSIPDTLAYSKERIPFFTRQSEYEKTPSLYESAQGVWLDEFVNPWINNDIIKKHQIEEKTVCIVSPELHGRDPIKRWSEYKHIISKSESPVFLCTDYPQKAKEFFNG